MKQVHLTAVFLLLLLGSCLAFHHPQPTVRRPPPPRKDRPPPPGKDRPPPPGKDGPSPPDGGNFPPPEDDGESDGDDWRANPSGLDGGNDGKPPRPSGLGGGKDGWPPMLDSESGDGGDDDRPPRPDGESGGGGDDRPPRPHGGSGGGKGDRPPRPGSGDDRPPRPGDENGEDNGGFEGEEGVFDGPVAIGLTQEEMDQFTSGGCGSVEIVDASETQFTLKSNGVPNHPWDNSVNPNSVTEKNHEFHILRNAPTALPDEGGCLNMGIIGFATNGVPIFNPLNHFGQNAVEGPYEEKMDSCGGHSSPFGEYHYHALSGCQNKGNVDELLGVALDGNPIYGTRATINGVVKDVTNEDLDECHGRWEGSSYRYHYNREFPYILGCYRGEVLNHQGSYGCDMDRGELCTCVKGILSFEQSVSRKRSLDDHAHNMLGRSLTLRQILDSDTCNASAARKRELNELKTLLKRLISGK